MGSGSSTDRGVMQLLLPLASLALASQADLREVAAAVSRTPMMSSGHFVIKAIARAGQAYSQARKGKKPTEETKKQEKSICVDD